MQYNIKKQSLLELIYQVIPSLMYHTAEHLISFQIYLIFNFVFTAWAADHLYIQLFISGLSANNFLC